MPSNRRHLAVNPELVTPTAPNAAAAQDGFGVSVHESLASPKPLYVQMTVGIIPFSNSFGNVTDVVASMTSVGTLTLARPYWMMAGTTGRVALSCFD